MLDLVFILVSLACIVGVSFSVYGGAGQARYVSIRTDEGVSMYALDRDRTVEARGPLGSTVIEISDGAVHVVSSPCKDKLCILKGELEERGDWTACMPNRVFIRIEGAGKGEVEDVSY